MIIRRPCITKYCRGTAKHNSSLCSKCKYRIWRDRHPLRAAYKRLRNNANRRGVPFNLTLVDFTRFCLKTNYLWLKGLTGDSMTIDRIFDDVGYQYDNIRMITRRQNSSRPKLRKVKYAPEGVPF